MILIGYWWWGLCLSLVCDETGRKELGLLLDEGLEILDI